MNLLQISKNRISIFTWMLAVIILTGGLLVSPLGRRLSEVPGYKLVVDALPDLSENRHVVVCKLGAANPRILEKKVTIPLSKWLLSQKNIKEVQALTMNAKVFLYIRMDDSPDFQDSYDGLTAILNRMPPQILPEEAVLEAGPPTNSVHQTFGFILNQSDSTGEFMPFLDPHELSALLQKEFIPELYAIEGVAEVAIAGGAGTEIQIIPDLEAMKGWGVSLESLTEQIEKSFSDNSSGTASFNGIEYFIEWDESDKDPNFFREMLIHGHEGTTALSSIAAVQTAASERNSLLIFEGHETSGAFISLYPDSDPSLVLTRVQKSINNIIQQWNLQNHGGNGGISSHVFYNRMDLIQKNMSTLREALILECLIAVFILCLFMSRFRIAIIVAIMVPLTISLVFIMMYFTGIRLHILSVAGLILAIGTVVDFGIILSQSVEEKLAQSENGNLREAIQDSMRSVLPLFITSASIVILAFIPVFLLEGTEGRMFSPLAWTKTLMMISALLLTLLILPGLLRSTLNISISANIGYGIGLTAALTLVYLNVLAGIAAIFIFLVYFLSREKPKQRVIVMRVSAVIFLIFYSHFWAPLGQAQLPVLNILFGTGLIAALLVIMHFNQIYYKVILGFLMKKAAWYGIFIVCFLIAGIWSFFRIPAAHLPVLNEGVYLHMPSLPHGADIHEVLDYGLILDSLYRSVPEVSSVVIKAGQAASSMDPAPISMFENFISVRHPIARDKQGKLIPAIKRGNTFSQLDSANFMDRVFRRSLTAWRPEIVDAENLWNLISEKSHIGGLSHAPGLQPVQARMIMQETSIQSPYFVKITGRDQSHLDTISEAVIQLLQSINEIDPYSIYYDKPTSADYIKVVPDTEKLKQAGISQTHLSHHLSHAFQVHSHSGQSVGNDETPVRIFLGEAYSKDPQAILSIPVMNPNGQMYLLGDLIDIEFERGAGMLRHEQGELFSAVTFLVKPEWDAQEILKKLSTSLKALPLMSGAGAIVDGEYEAIRKSSKRNIFLLTLTLCIIALILYWRLGSAILSGIVLMSVTATLSAGMFLYFIAGTEWTRAVFLHENLGLHTGAWIGFIALAGLSVQESLIMLSNIKEEISKGNNLEEQIKMAGSRRIGAAMLTIGTTLLALLPIVTGKSQGYELLVPLVLPIVGGLLFQLLGVYLTPILAMRYYSKKHI